MDRQDILTQVRTSLNPVAMGRTRNRKAAAAAAAWPDIVKLLEMAGVSSATLQNIHPRETMDCMIARLRERGYLNGYKISIKSLLGREIPRKSKNPLSQYIVWLAGIFYDKPKGGGRDFTSLSERPRATTLHANPSSNYHPTLVTNPPFPVIFHGSENSKQDSSTTICVICDNRDDYTIIMHLTGENVYIVEGCTWESLNTILARSLYKDTFWRLCVGDYNEFDPLLHGDDTRVLACAQVLHKVMTSEDIPGTGDVYAQETYVGQQIKPPFKWEADRGPNNNSGSLGLGNMSFKRVDELMSFVGVFIGLTPPGNENRAIDVGILLTTSTAFPHSVWIYDEKTGGFTLSPDRRHWNASSIWALPYIQT